MSNAEVYQAVTDRMVAALERGTVPWQKGWKAQRTLPMRMNANQPYRGINIWLLALSAADAGYTSPWWGTYGQIAAKAGMVKVPRPNGRGSYWVSPDGTERGVRKGEKHTKVILWKPAIWRGRDAESGEDTASGYLLAREFQVFNACQANALPERYYPQPGEAPAEVATAEVVIKGYLSREDAPSLAHDGGSRAFYRFYDDSIHLPTRASFKDADHYYDTAFHECIHSTGHACRCNRPGITDVAEGAGQFGTHVYGVEELTAEMGSAMLGTITGTDTHFENSAGYLAGWLAKIKEDPRMVVTAASQASKAADYILGTEPGPEPGGE